MSSLWIAVASVGVSALQVGAASAGVGSIVAQADQLLEVFKRQDLEATPGVRTKVQQIANDLGAVIPKIEEGHHATQLLLNQTVDHWESQELLTVAEKTAATNNDTIWYDCVDEELGILIELESHEAALPHLIAVRDGHCQSANDTSVSDRSLPDSAGTFSCDMTNNPDACLDAFADHNSTVRSQLAALSGEVVNDVELWDLHITLCGEKWEEYRELLDTIDRFQTDYADKRALCETKYATRVGSFCTFSSAYNSQCAAKATYLQLEEDTKRDDRSDENPHSAPDREEEFTVVSMSKCHLDEFLAGTDDKCKKKNFKFDKHLIYPQSLPEVFTCEEQSFTFSGKTWILPANRQHSTDYVSQDPFAVDANFDFCPIDQNHVPIIEQ